MEIDKSIEMMNIKLSTAENLIGDGNKMISQIIEL